MVDGIKKAIDYIKSNDLYVEKAINRQDAVWHQNNRDKPDMPVLALTCGLTEEQSSWLPWYNYKDIHFDNEKMFVNGLRDVLSAVNGNYGAVPSMRANMGCGIIPSLFGTQQRLFDDKMPWLVDHVKKEDVQKKYISDIFDMNDSEEFAAAMNHMDYMTANLRDNSLANIFVYPLDLQGAVDTAHLIYGDTMFYDLYDDPEFVHNLLAASCDAIDFAMRECFKRIDKIDEFVAHYNHLAIPKDLGGLKLSEDTTTLLSPHLIDEFAKPYIHDILERFGGGYVHYCGKNDHLLEVILAEPLVRGINFGNPEKHDMSKILAKCRDNKKIYVGGLQRREGENYFDFFTRILEPSYDKDTGCFYIIPEYGCNINERGNVIGEFEKAAETIMNMKN